MKKVHKKYVKEILRVLTTSFYRYKVKSQSIFNFHIIS